MNFRKFNFFFFLVRTLQKSLFPVFVCQHRNAPYLFSNMSCINASRELFWGGRINFAPLLEHCSTQFPNRFLVVRSHCVWHFDVATNLSKHSIISNNQLCPKPHILTIILKDPHLPKVHCFYFYYYCCCYSYYYYYCCYSYYYYYCCYSYYYYYYYYYHYFYCNTTITTTIITTTTTTTTTRVGGDLWPT